MTTSPGLKTPQKQQQSVKNECGKVTYCHSARASHASQQSYNQTTENYFILMENPNKDGIEKLQMIAADAPDLLIFALCSSQARASSSSSLRRSCSLFILFIFVYFNSYYRHKINCEKTRLQ